MGEEVDYESLEPADPNGPPRVPASAYRVREDGEYQYEEVEQDRSEPS